METGDWIVKPNGEIKIEHGIPIPEKWGASRWKRLIAQMQVGDSFVVQTEVERRAIYHRNKSGVTMTSRKLDKGQGWRVWRVK